MTNCLARSISMIKGIQIVKIMTLSTLGLYGRSQIWKNSHFQIFSLFQNMLKNYMHGCDAHEGFQQHFYVHSLLFYGSGPRVIAVWSYNEHVSNHRNFKSALSPYTLYDLKKNHLNAWLLCSWTPLKFMAIRRTGPKAVPIWLLVKCPKTVPIWLIHVVKCPKP